MSCKTHPIEILNSKSTKWSVGLHEKKFAQKLDEEDNFGHFRDKFYYPKKKDLYHVDSKYLQNDNEESVYLCGHSLGLMPKKTENYVQRELEKWKKIGVQGHVQGELPWVRSDEFLVHSSARLIGAKPKETALMNALTINLHLLLISFYRPTKERYKILLESYAFPSDHYAIESQIKLHNLNPEDCMLCVKPRERETTIRMEDIVDTIKKEGSSIAVIMFSGVQYYTGQVFDMQEITKLGHEKGCYVGFDLAHAIGNVPMSMHAWGVDFACWCTYKYLCSGAGGLGGLYVHEKFDRANLPKLHGWWSHRLETRFLMDNILDVSQGAHAYRVSNPSGLLSACLLASLEVFDEVDMTEYRNKSLLMSAYFENLVMSSRYYDREDEKSQNILQTKSHDPFPKIKIITPFNPNERGCQFSIVFSNAKSFIPIFKEISARGVVLDKREPNSLRFSFNPFYNRFVDIFNFIEILEASIEFTSKI